VFSLLLFAANTLIPALLGVLLAATPWARTGARSGSVA
jgi:hypothetical protein